MAKDFLDNLTDRLTSMGKALIVKIKKNPFECVMILLVLWALLGN